MKIKKLHALALLTLLMSGKHAIGMHGDEVGHSETGTVDQHAIDNEVDVANDKIYSSEAKAEETTNPATINILKSYSMRPKSSFSFPTPRTAKPLPDAVQQAIAPTVDATTANISVTAVDPKLSVDAKIQIMETKITMLINLIESMQGKSNTGDITSSDTTPTDRETVIAQNKTSFLDQMKAFFKSSPDSKSVSQTTTEYWNSFLESIGIRPKAKTPIIKSESSESMALVVKDQDVQEISDEISEELATNISSAKTSTELVVYLNKAADKAIEETGVDVNDPKIQAVKTEWINKYVAIFKNSMINAFKAMQEFITSLLSFSNKKTINPSTELTIHNTAKDLDSESVSQNKMDSDLSVSSSDSDLSVSSSDLSVSSSDLSVSSSDLSASSIKKIIKISQQTDKTKDVISKLIVKTTVSSLLTTQAPKLDTTARNNILTSLSTDSDLLNSIPEGTDPVKWDAWIKNNVSPKVKSKLSEKSDKAVQSTTDVTSKESLTVENTDAISTQVSTDLQESVSKAETAEAATAAVTAAADEAIEATGVDANTAEAKTLKAQWLKDWSKKIEKGWKSMTFANFKAMISDLLARLSKTKQSQSTEVTAEVDNNVEEKIEVNNKPTINLTTQDDINVKYSGEKTTKISKEQVDEWKAASKNIQAKIDAKKAKIETNNNAAATKIQSKLRQLRVKRQLNELKTKQLTSGETATPIVTESISQTPAKLRSGSIDDSLLSSTGKKINIAQLAPLRAATV